MNIVEERYMQAITPKKSEMIINLLNTNCHIDTDDILSAKSMGSLIQRLRNLYNDYGS